MCAECTQGDDGLVSLFTREWIEIIPFVLFFFHRLSPSLRGSGLKCCIGMALWLEREVSLFTREWIEMALYSVWLTLLLSPSLRGSGLKFTPSPDGRKSRLSPSLRGSGLKSFLFLTNILRFHVSLFTREWIEIDSSQGLPNVSAVSLFTRGWID